MLLSFFNHTIGNEAAELYLGNHGSFDRFMLHCGKAYRREHPNTSLIYITPYFKKSYKKEPLSNDYDAILYPPIEHVPLKYAIFYCNRWMVQQADIVVAYVNHDWGGAYQTYRYANKLGKRVVNFGTLHPSDILAPANDF